MVLISAGLFLFNLLCALAPCDPKLDLPEVRVKKSFQENQLHHSPMVITTNGGLEGYTIFSTEARLINAFEGIPYAEPPVDKLRFRTPVPKAPWLGVKFAKKLRPECLQLSPLKLLRVVGDEDCLYLNVYTRQLQDFSNEKKLLPVIFYIHGGSYYFGNAGDYGPAYLLNHEVVLVSVNYRVGVLGFMSTGDSASPGNYGLKDQALALKWVSENIKYFGGDPNRVTIVGQSSGAACTHFHSMSPMSKHLFRSGVSFSGSAFTHWSYKSAEEAVRLTARLAGMVGCSGLNRASMVDCLRKRNPVEVVSAEFRLLDWVPFPIVVFAPVIEQESEDAFITVTPQEFYSKFNASQGHLKPWIFGMTSEEGYLGLLFLKLLFGEYSLRHRWSQLAPAFLDFQHTAKDPKALSNKLASLYFNEQSPKNAPNSSIAQLFGDRLFLHGVFKAITLHSQLAPTFAYYFQFKGKYNAANVYGFSSEEWGVGHTEDLYYYFNSSTTYPGFKRSDKEYQLSHILTTFLTTFAEFGEPLMTTDGRKLVKVWEPVDPKHQQFLRIDRDIRMIPRPMEDRFALWDNFPPDMKRDLNLR